MKRFKNQPKIHEPVLTKEVLGALRLKKIAPLNNQAREQQGQYIDATLGTGGHSVEIVKKGRILGIDADKTMLEIAEKRLKKACPIPHRRGGCFKLVHDNFANIDEIAKSAGFAKVDGIIFDLGISIVQLTSPRRGFSFQQKSAPLDMRLDRKAQGLTAADLLNVLRRDQLRHLFEVTVRQRQAKRLAYAVVLSRKTSPINTVGEFLEITFKAVGPQRAQKRISKRHPATLAFLALRIAVNSELENLKQALPRAFSLLKKGGRLVVISFHSGEDTLVKKFNRQVQIDGKALVITKKPVLPVDDEIKRNPRARSAKMRVLERK